MTTSADAGAAPAGPRSARSADATGDVGAVTAAARTELTLAWSWVGFRVGAVVALLGAVVAAPPHGARVVPEAVLTLIVTADCAVVATVFLRAGRLPLGWAVADLVVVVAVVGASSWPAVLPGAAGQSPFYDFTVIAAPTVGLPAWSPTFTLVGGAGLAFMDFVPALRPGSSYPRWNALPDAVTVLGLAVLALMLARLLRGSAAALDRHRQAALERAAALARQRERLRQQTDLNSHLMATVEALAAGGAITDPTIVARLRAEASGLRQFVEAGPASGGGGLVAGLRELVAEKAATGLRVDFEPEDDIVSRPGAALAARTVAALVGATREALTNVRKHAGTDRAALALSVVDNGVRVTVTDAGRGYDAATTVEGFGQRRSLRHRIAAEGGLVDIESTPDSGTRVSLWVPFSSGEGGGPR